MLKPSAHLTFRIQFVFNVNLKRSKLNCFHVDGTGKVLIYQEELPIHIVFSAALHEFSEIAILVASMICKQSAVSHTKNAKMGDGNAISLHSSLKVDTSK